MNKILPILVLVVFSFPILESQVQEETPDPHPKVNLTKISSVGVIHRFFDTSPVSPSGKFLALFRFPSEKESPKPGDKGQVILVDLASGKERVVASSHGFEMQLGANVQWGSTDEQLFFNDVDTSTWEAFTVQLNPFSGELKKLKGSVFMVSNDGKKIASYNLSNSRLAQVGYGIMVPDDRISRNFGLSVEDGIYVTDIANGEQKLLVSIKDIFENAKPSILIENPSEYEIYCFQVKWNPQGTRLLTTVQWIKKGEGERKRAVITMGKNGDNIKTAITPEQWSKGGHHINWMPDGDHLSMNLNIDGIHGLEIISVKYDGSEMKTVYPKGSGHPSFHPLGLPLIITDAYAGEMQLENNKVPIRLIDVQKQNEVILAAIHLPKIEGNWEFRVDAHPAWDRSGRYVVFNGYEEGSRCVYIADLNDILKGYRR